MLETEGEGRLSRPLASIVILSATHFKDEISGKVCTKGKYLVNEVFDRKDRTVYFESYARIRERK